MSPRSILFAFYVAMLTVSSSTALAQTVPSTPTAEQCLLQPLDPESLIDIVDAGFTEPLPLMATRLAVPQDMIDWATEIVAGSLACTNANQPLAALAAYTDRWLAQRFSGDAGQDELGHLLAAVTRSPSPAADPDRIALIAVKNPIMYNGERLGLTVTTQNADVTFVDELIFIQSNGAWMIDQIIPISDSTDAVTPTT